MNKIKVIALFGKSASGKDSIQRWIIKSFPSATHSIISCTTRPRRDYEEDKKDYFFLTNEEFTNKVLDGSMLEATEFNNWFYGTPIEALDKDKINIGVFNPAGIDALLSDSRIEVIPLYVLAPDKTFWQCRFPCCLSCLSRAVSRHRRIRRRPEGDCQCAKPLHSLSLSQARRKYLPKALCSGWKPFPIHQNP